MALELLPQSYVALRPELVLKVDGERPIMYLIDDDDTGISYLPPRSGLALSLLNGRRTLAEAEAIFSRVFPDTEEDSDREGGDPAVVGQDVRSILTRTDTAMRASASRRSKMPGAGIYDVSPRQIPDAIDYDPRDFVIDLGRYASRIRDPRLRYRLEEPINIIMAATHRCFTRCVYCYAERPVSREMPLRRWEELMDEMVELGIHVVSPDNGDILARKDGMRLLEMMIEREFDFLLSTKAHLEPHQVRRLIGAGFANPIRRNVFRDVQLSIDAVDPEVSKRILGVSRSRVEGNARTFASFKEFGIAPRVKAVITSLNSDQVLPIVEAYYPLGARAFTFSRYIRSFFNHQDGLSITPQANESVVLQLVEAHQRYPDAELAGDFVFEPGPEPTPPTKEEVWAARSGCGGGWSCLGIAAGGEAFLCEQMVLRPPHVVGDLNTQSIREVWESERLRRFIFPDRDEFEGTVCHDCGEFEDCMWSQGRCYRDAYFSYGSIYHPPPMCPRNERPGLPVV
jgi:radical SAM protein with 4Fe4S-binding SPASM domain